jgi:DnaJ like chaperone protein
MSIWGKVIGGVAGFAMGGPFGALMGAAAGHAMDRMRETGPRDDQQLDPNDMEARQVAFTMAVIVLGAKLAKVDGKVTTDEVAAFKRVFSVPAGEATDVGKLFNEAKQDARGFEPYARQIAQVFSNDRVMLEDLMGALFHIAKADGKYHPAERDYLAKVAIIFGLGRQDFERLEDTYIKGEDADDPYEILGVSKDASDDDIKSTYRKLIRENHPDTMMAKGLPQEFIDLANEKMATINAAYDRVCKQRGIK